MNVGRAIVDGVKQDLLDELDDRRIVNILRSRISNGLPRLFFTEIEIDVVVSNGPQHIFWCFRDLGHQRHEFAVVDDDRINRQPGLETDFIQRPQVGGVSNGNGQAVAALVERHYAVRSDQLTVDRILGNQVGIECIQIQQGIAKGFRRKNGNLAGTRLVCRNDLIDQRNFGGQRLLHQFFRLGLLEPPGLDQSARETADWGVLWGCRHRSCTLDAV